MLDMQLHYVGECVWVWFVGVVHGYLTHHTPILSLYFSPLYPDNIDLLSQSFSGL